MSIYPRFTQLSDDFIALSGKLDNTTNHTERLRLLNRMGAVIRETDTLVQLHLEESNRKMTDSVEVAYD